MEGGNRGPREASSTKLQAGFVANQDFLGFWTVNICLRRCAGCTPRKPSGRSGEAISRRDHARQTPDHLGCSDLGRAQNAGPTESAPQGLPKCLNPSSLDLGSAYNPGPASDSSQQSNLEPKQCRWGKHTCREWEPTQCARDTASTLTHASVIYLQRPSLPTARLNK